MMRPWSSWVRAAVLGPVILLSSVALGCTQAEDPLEVEPAVIRAVRYHVEPARTRVWFKTSGTMFYTHYSPDPLTLVIDLPGVDITAISDRIVVGSQEVESIVATRLDGGGDKSLSRIEIKLSSLVPYQISATEHALTVLFEGEGSPAEAHPRSAPSPRQYQPTLPRRRHPLTISSIPMTPSPPKLSSPSLLPSLPSRDRSARRASPSCAKTRTATTSPSAGLRPLGMSQTQTLSC